MLRNAKNGQHRDRGTQHFAIEGSVDNVVWGQLAHGKLPDVRYMYCIEFPNTTGNIERSVQFIRFIARTCYGFGCGLEYIKINPDTRETCAKNSMWTEWTQCYPFDKRMRFRHLDGKTEVESKYCPGNFSVSRKFCRQKLPLMTVSIFVLF